MSITAARLMVVLGGDTSGAEKALSSVSNRLDAFGDSAMQVGRNLSAWVTAPLVGLGVAAAKTAADFDKNMNVLRATSGATAQEMDALRQEAVKLGADLSLPKASAAGAAEAMLEMSKAGLKTTDVMNGTRGVLQLAAAGELSTAQAAEIAANALNAFGLAGGETIRIADLLAAAAVASSADVSDLADSMRMASSVFASAGVPIEDLTAAISLMANAGIKGQDAGTSLKQMLLALQAPSNKAADLMQELGISIYDAQGNMIPLADIIDTVQSALIGLTQEQRNTALATIFGSDAVRAANILLMGGVEQFNAMKDAVTQEGRAAELAAAQTEGLGGAFDRLKTAGQTALLTAIEPFQDDINDLAISITNAITAFSNLDEGTRKILVGIAVGAAAIGPAIVVVGAFAKAFGAASAAVKFFIPLLGMASTAVKAWNVGLTLTTALEAGFGAWAVTLGAIGIAVGAVAAVWMTWNEEIVKTNQEGAKAVSSTWTQFFDDQVASGKNAVAVADEYVAAQERVRAELEKTNPVVRLFISDQVELSASYGEASQAIMDASTSYEDYRAALERVADANGLLIDAEGNLITQRTEDFGTYDVLIEKNYLLAEATYDTSKWVIEAAKAANQEEAGFVRNAIAASSAAAAHGTLAGAVAEATARMAEMKAAAIEASDIISITKTSLESAQWGAQQAGMAIQALQVSLGLMSPQAAQTQNDVQMLADAFANGVISAEEFNTYMQQAAQGSLSLDAATRAGIAALTQHAQAMRKDAEAAKEAAISQLQLAQSLKDATNAQIAQAAISELQNAYESGLISFEDYVTAVSGVQDAFGLADAKSRALAAGLALLTQALADGRLPADQYDEALEGLIKDSEDGIITIGGLTVTFNDTLTAVTPATAGINQFDESMKGAANDAKTSSDQIRGAFGNVNWTQLGKDIGQGIADGIRQSTGDIADAAADAADAAEGAVKTATESNSPSKVFMRLGAGMMTGGAMGINQESAAMANAARQASLRAIAAATTTPVYGGGAETVSGVAGQTGRTRVQSNSMSGSSGNPIHLVVNIAGQELRRVILNTVGQEVAA